MGEDGVDFEVGMLEKVVADFLCSLQWKYVVEFEVSIEEGRRSLYVCVREMVLCNL